MKHSFLLALITFLGTAISPATEAMLSYGGNTVGGYVSGTAGWTFSTTANISITALGVLDNIYTSPNGLNQGPISVGLWDQTGALMVSSSVASNSFLLNSTRYESVTPTFLSAGLTYYLGAYSPAGIILLSGEDPSDGGLVTTSPEIQLGMAVADFSEFGFPTKSLGGPGSALFAPNFQFVDAVPEPSFGALLILGVALLAKNRMTRAKLKI